MPNNIEANGIIITAVQNNTDNDWSYIDYDFDYGYKYPWSSGSYNKWLQSDMYNELSSKYSMELDELYFNHDNDPDFDNMLNNFDCKWQETFDEARRIFELPSRKSRIENLNL